MSTGDLSVFNQLITPPKRVGGFQGSAPASETNPARLLKRVNPKASDDNLHELLVAISHLDPNLPVQQEVNIQAIEAKYLLVSTRLTPFFPLEESEIKNVFEASQKKNILFPSDQAVLVLDAVTIQAQRSKEATEQLAPNSSPANQLLIINLLSEINNAFADTLRSLRAIIHPWQDGIQITLKQEEDFFRKQQNKEYQELLDLAGKCLDYYAQLRGLYDQKFLDSLANNADAAPDYSQFADELGQTQLPNGETVKDHAKSQQESGQTAVGETQPTKTIGPTPEQVPVPSIQAGSSQPTAFNSSIAQLSQSLSTIISQSLLTAYTTSEDGKKSNLKFDSLPENLQLALRNQLAPQVENFIMSLTADEVDTLLNNKPGASTVRLKILKKTHEFAIGYPPFRLLIQQAINNHHAQLDAAAKEEANQAIQQESQPPTQTQTQAELNQLQTAVTQTTHAVAIKRLEQAAQAEWTFDDRQTAQLSNVIATAQLNPQEFRRHFDQLLAEILDRKNAQVETALARTNLETTIASLLIGNPFLSPAFLDYLDERNIAILFGKVFPTKIFKKKRPEIIALLKQYWYVYRAELNKVNPSLAQLGEAHPTQTEFSPRQVKQEISKAAFIRQQIKEKTSLNGEETVTLLGKTDDVGLVGSAITKKDNKRISQLKQFFWNSASVQEKAQYLEQIGLGDKIKQACASIVDHKGGQSQQITHDALSHDIVDEILRESGQEFDYFIFIATQIRYQQVAVLQSAANLAALSQFTSNQNLISSQLNLLTQIGDDQPLFYFPSQQFDTGSFDHYPQYAFQDWGADCAASASLNMRQRASNQGERLLKRLAAMGVDTALSTATGGAYQAIPKPIRDFINNALVEESLKRLRVILEFLKIAGATVAAIIAAIIALIQSTAALVGAAAGGLIAGGLALVLGGGILPAIVAFLAGTIAGFLAGKGISGALLSPSSSSILQQTQQNISAAGSSLGREALSQSGLNPNLPQSTNPIAGQGGGMGASGRMMATSAGTAASTQAAIAVTTGVTVLPIITATTMMTLFGAAFLMDYPLTPKELNEKGISMYASVRKTAQIVNDSSGCKNLRSCPDPVYPVVVEYTIIIEPKGEYTIELTAVEDKTTYLFNEEEYPPPASVPVVADKIGFELLPDQILPSVSNPILLNKLDEDATNDQYVLTYQEKYDSLFNHVLIRNLVKVNFNYSFDGKSGSDKASSMTSVALGNAPDDLLCWPNSGQIFSYPFEPNNPTHHSWDAYDITPVGQESRLAYAPYDGFITKGIDQFGYGNYISISINYLGDDYLLIIAHLENTILDDGSYPAPYYVNRGEVIGTVGTTGNSTGPHVHFEKRRESAGSLTLTELMTGQSTVLPLRTPINSCADL